MTKTKKSLRGHALLAVVGLAMTVAIAACTDQPAPRTEEGGGTGLQSLPLIEPLDPPGFEKGVVPDVTHVQAGEAGQVVKRAGFRAELDAQRIEFTKGGRISAADVVCTIEPGTGSTPPKGSTVTLVYDDKCAASTSPDSGVTR